MKALQAQIEQLKKQADKNVVDTAMAALSQSVSKPAGIFDPYVALAALEQAATVASEKKDARATKLNIVFRQCRSLVGRPELQEILIKLVAEKQEADVAKVISKVLKKGGTDAPPTRGWGAGRARPLPYPTRGRRKPSFTGNCFTCGRSGHIARFCPSRKA